MIKNFIPYALPSIGDEEINEVVDSLRSGWVTTGPKVKQFEQDFANYTGARNAIAVNSCTAGLHLALIALDIGSGDEVIAPSLTFCSTVNVIEHCGARPVLVEVDNDFNISVDAIEKAITPRTKAIIPVHYGGQACDLEPIYDLATKHGLYVIEDGAHAAGTTYQDKKIGSGELFYSLPRNAHSKNVVSYSFYATKNLTTGEGGMVVTEDNELAEKIRLLTLHGMSRDAWKRYTNAGSWYYEVVEAGYKYNMTDIQAALGIHQLRKLDNFINIRQKYAQIYNEAFSSIEEIETPIHHNDRNHTYHLYVIRLKLEALRIDRAQFINKLREDNIGTSVHYIPVHLHPYYRKKYGYSEGSLPYTEKLYKQIISLPLYPKMSEDQINYVAERVRKIINDFRK